MFHTVFHVKKNDLVQVMVGRDKGKTGKILRVNQKKCGIVVEKLNMVKRHKKPSGKQPGGILDLEALIPASNVLLYCEKCARGVRTRGKVVKGDKKARFCRKCDTQIDK